MSNLDRFKFRFWHEQEKEMFFQGDQYLFSFLRRICTKYNVTHPSYLSFQIEERLTQCTGLRDKNDKLIYEGDIVQDIDKNIFTIEYGEAEAGFYLYCQKSFRTFYFTNNNKDYGVIGNIYENPDL